jgi:hypothetical protein
MGASETAEAAEAAELAGELYLVPPARFVAAREELVRTAREAGHHRLAGQLQGLRRPTHSAWLVNLLVRHEPAPVGNLAALGRQLRHAQTRLDGTQLRRLCVQRRQVIADLLHRARRLAADAGVRPTGQVLCEVEATLHAALVDLAASSAVLSGRLLRPMSHYGFGPTPHLPTELASAATSPSDPGPVPPLAAAPASRTVAPPAEGRCEDEWVFWPVQPVQPERPAAAAEHGAAARQAPRVSARSRAETRLRLVGPACSGNRAGDTEPAAHGPGSPGRLEDELAEAESAQWRREQELATAEAAVEEAREEVAWFEQQRMVARYETAAAERRLAEARAAQRSSIRAVTEARRALDAAQARRRPAGEPDNR